MLRPVVGLCLLVAIAPWLTLDLRGPLCDDFALREWVVQRGWFGAWYEHAESWGPFRPLGFAFNFAVQRWLWDFPAVAQLILMVLSVISVLLLYRLISQMLGGGDPWAPVIAAGLFASWPACTESVAWVTCGVELLPAAIFVLLALSAFLQGHFVRGLVFYALSLGFHDQHILTPVLFTILSFRITDRRRAMIWSAAFWAVAIGIGLALAATATTSRQPLGMAGLAGRLGNTFGDFWQTVFWQTAGQWVRGTGAAASFRDYARDLPIRLVLVLLGTVAGILLMRSGRTGSSCSRRDNWILIVIGITISVASLMTVALADLGAQARYTLWLGVGLACVCGGICSLSQGRLRYVVLAVMIGLVIASSLTRIGRMHEWTVRTCVLADVLRDLPRDLPPGGLVVVEGIRGYGRGFERSWGLSAAYRMAGGPPGARVSTLLRRQENQWVANEPPDVVWPVDASTRFQRWDPAGRRLLALSSPCKQ